MPQKKRAKPPVGKKVCIECQKEKSLSQFYTTTNPMVSNDGRTVNICKACVKNGSYNVDGSLNTELFKQKLMLMDKPFVPMALEAAIKEVNHSLELGKGRTDVIGCYFKNVSTLPQYSKLGFLESLSLLNQGKEITDAVTTTEKKTRQKEEVYVKQIDDFVVTNDIIDLFGEGYTKTEYRLMTRKFEKLKQNYTIQTNLHEEALATYVRFKVKEEQCTALGDVGGAEKWNKAAQDAADKAKLSPKQLSKSDLQGGLNSFSELLMAVEQAKDIIPILPRFKFRPNDAIDFNIYCIINYLRDLEGKPLCEYEDVYKFYDERKKEYIDQYGDPYGIFEGDTTESNRDSIKNFITVPDDYYKGD
ncbi:MAG: hypothetical protein II304_07585 [Bacteroidales bacterium]|nr:hypothetical protein [Bacteroidales bacterium]